MSKVIWQALWTVLLVQFNAGVNVECVLRQARVLSKHRPYPSIIPEDGVYLLHVLTPYIDAMNGDYHGIEKELPPSWWERVADRVLT